MCDGSAMNERRTCDGSAMNERRTGATGKRGTALMRGATGKRGAALMGGLLGAFVTRMPYTNVSIAPRCCDITTAAPAKVGSEVVKEARKQRQHYKRAVRDAADSAACSQSEVRVPAYCLLAADSICRNLKDLLQNAQTVQ